MKDNNGLFGRVNEFGKISGILVVAFCGFYLKWEVLCLVYWAALLATGLYGYLIYKGKVQPVVDDAIMAAIVFCGYALLTHLFHGVNSSFINVVFSTFYFILTYEILISISKENIILFCKKLFWVSIALLIVEAVWRFTHPVWEQSSIYKFKFNSIMYMDSNFVAIFVMCIFFLAFYLYENHNVDLKKELITLFVLMLLTLSRASIMVMVICAVLFTKRIPWEWKKKLIVFGGLVALILLLIMLNDESNKMRFYIVELALYFYTECASVFQMLFGIGFGRTAEYIGFGSHLLLITYLLESGAVGLIVLSAFWFVLLRKSNFKAGYVMVPFLIAGFAMAPHFIPYQYCAYAVIIVLEEKSKQKNNRQPTCKVSKRERDEVAAASDGKVSVIIPVYNAEKYLNRCLDSLLSQTFQNLEMLLIDDGSTDNSLKICHDYARKDNRVVVYHHDNHGVSYTRNRGMELATGNYITFVDADDWVEPTYIEKLYTPLDTYGLDISMCGYGIAHGDGRFVSMLHFDEGVVPMEEALDLFSPYYLGAVCSKMYARSALFNRDGYAIRFDEDISICEDQLFWVRAVLNARRIYATCEPLYHYWMNDESAMRSRGFNGCYTDYMARRRMGELLFPYPELAKANTVFCTAAAAQAISAADLPLKDNRVSELNAFIKTNFCDFITHPQVSTREKIRVVLVSTEFTRKLLCEFNNYKQKIRT